MRVLFLEIDTESTWAVASIGPAFIASYLRQRGHEAVFLRVGADMRAAGGAAPPGGRPRAPAKSARRLPASWPSP